MIRTKAGLLLVLLRRLRYRLYRLFRRRIRSFNVLDYGADPHGILDSTHALQDAIDNVKYIEILPGHFNVKRTATTRPNTTIVGSGQQSTHLEGQEGPDRRE